MVWTVLDFGSVSEYSSSSSLYSGLEVAYDG